MGKGMKQEEIVQALRCRARHEKATNEGCKKCPYWATENLEEWRKLCGWASCKVYRIISDAADAIERLTAENAVLPDGQASAIETLHKEIEWKDMVIALAQREQAKAEAERDALLEIAKQGKDCKTCKNNVVCVQPGIGVAHRCDRCVEKCPCYGCEGGHWEWRGLPGAPEEGDYHEPKT